MTPKHFLLFLLFAVRAISSLAEQPAETRELSVEQIQALAGGGGPAASAASPLAASALWPAPLYSRETVAELAKAGLLTAEGSLAPRGREIWEALAEPEVAIQARRISKRGIGGAWYVARGDGLWVFEPRSGGGFALTGPLPRASAGETIAKRIGPPPPSKDAGATESLTLEEMLVFAALDGQTQLASLPERGAGAVTSFPASRISSEALSPARLQALVSDPTLDSDSLCLRLADAAAVTQILEGLARRERVTREGEGDAARWSLTPSGARLGALLFHPGEALALSALVPSGTGARAASLRLASSPEGLVVSQYSPDLRRFVVSSIAPGRDGEVAKAIDGLLRALAVSAPLGALPEIKPPSAGAGRFGDVVLAELKRGEKHAGKATTTRETWGRGRPDTTSVDNDGDGRPDVEYEDTDGDDAPDFVRVRDARDLPWTRSFVLVDGAWKESNIVEAALEVSFALPWDRTAYHPHNVDIVLNGRPLAQLTDTVPEGRYRFPIRPQDLKVSADASLPNDVRIQTTHLRGGHYVVSSGFRLVVRMSEVTRYVVASSPEEAEQAVRERAHLVASGADPSVYSNEWRAEPPAPQTGQKVLVRGAVRNSGMDTAKNVRVAFYDGDPAAPGAKPFAEKTIASIEAGVAAPAEGEWTASAGAHRISIVVEFAGDREPANNGVAVNISGGGDKEPPAVLMTEPGDGASISAGKCRFAGTAQDNVGLAALEYSVDGGVWKPIPLKPRWDFEAELTSGDHRVVVRARDTSGLEAQVAAGLKVK